ncbi:hypothetical protein pdam_00007048, partial [Pocillopora damicornis]
MFVPKRSAKKGKSNKNKFDINQEVIQLIQEASQFRHAFIIQYGNRVLPIMESGYHDTGFYPSMPSSLGAQQTTKERMSEGSYGNPLLYGNGNTKH